VILRSTRSLTWFQCPTNLPGFISSVFILKLLRLPQTKRRFILQVAHLTPGLSLFSLLAHTNTPQGHALLRQWLLSPLQSIAAIRERQEAVAFFQEPAIQNTVRDIQIALKRTGDVNTGLNGIRRGGMCLISKSVDLGAKRMVGKKSSGAAEWKSVLQVVSIRDSPYGSSVIMPR
jgi:MutS domain III